MQKPFEEQHVLSRFVIGDSMNSADAVDFGSTDATAITHPRWRWLTGRVIPLGWNIEDVPLSVGIWSFGIDSLVNGLGRVGSFDLGRRIDELKVKKAINIVGESNIERKLWWDLGSIDMLMSRSVFLGRTCGKTIC
ncbi:hypothetical protein OIU85_015231 [Salix viminalis]|uniref:Uncharacterized protein n=1 Tax=Salix viminalis TaxID=40686 RepID=A0A9Q0NKH1_SALVM|nr:hypothetical protein OIU85_015231 [Salix viminalis]